MQAGIFSPDKAAISNFLRVVQAKTSCIGTTRSKVVQYPENEPCVAVAICDEQNRPVRLASHPDGSFVVVEGDIYNNKDELDYVVGNGHSAQSDGPSIILDAYLSFGPAFLAQLNAAANIVIWDADKQNLIMYRDRWGQMSQCYFDNRDLFVWASDLETLLLMDVPRDVDADALDFFLAAGYFPAPWTGLTHVKKIPPSHVLKRTRIGTLEVRSLWRATGKPKLEISGEETTERLQTLLTRSVQRRYEAGSKTGVLLSGGVDSALLVGVLKKLVGADLETFTFHYTGYQGPFNESPLARETAKYFNTPHHVIEVAPSDVAYNLDRMVLAYEEPFTYGLHTYFLRDVVRGGVSLLMSGAGVNDWYASRWDLLAKRLRKLPVPFHAVGRALDTSLGGIGENWSRKIGNLALGAANGLPNKANVSIASDAVRRTLYQDPRRAMGRHRLCSLLRPVVDDIRGESDRDQITILNQRLFIAECNLHWYNRWEKAWNIHFRHPYYDNDLQEFMMHLKRSGRDKPEIRSVAARLMPQSIAYAPKLAHTIPIREWFRGPLLDLLWSHLTTDRLREGGIFEPASVRRLIDEHVNGRANHEWILVTILTTTMWHDVVLGDGKAPMMRSA